MGKYKRYLVSGMRRDTEEMGDIEGERKRGRER